MHNYVDIQDITFEEFMDIYEQTTNNIKTIREAEGDSDYLYGLPRLNNYYYTRLINNIEDGEINAISFRDRWDVVTLIQHWNDEPFGRKYKKLVKHYEKVANDPKSMELLRQIVVQTSSYYSSSYQKTKKCIKEGKFLSFWNWNTFYSDTKGSWRHWWDTVSNDPMFKIGDMVELRSNATNNHVFQVKQHWSDPNYKYLKHCHTSMIKKIKNKVFVVLQYDKYKPLRTYSYKKSQGSHRIVSILPVGSTEIFYIPEQFLKTSRKKAIKDAKK
jgi:hypothetical protein